MTDIFLAQHLGGVAESIGEDFKSSAVAVSGGVEHAPGSNEILNKK